MSSQSRNSNSEPIAIIGMGCRFPGPDGGTTASPEAFWQVLHDGVDVLQEVPASRWNVDSLYEPQRGQPGRVYVRHGYFLSDIQGFDFEFFGLCKEEADALDPQQRLALEVAWDTLEHAHIPPSSLSETDMGIFLSTFWDDYSAQRLHLVAPHSVTRYSMMSAQRSLAGGRIAHLLGVHGPNVNVDSACSGGLTGLHLACQSLRAGETNLALVGAVYLMLTPEPSLGLCDMGVVSADGRCKPFDQNADGFGQGEGCAMLLVKRLSDAQQAGDRVLALVRGSAVNHDGRSRSIGMSNGLAQQRLLHTALERSGISPQQIQYVEAQGVGSKFGDVAEAFSIGEIYGKKRQDALPIGSVKSNVGHTSCVAGIAGLIKTVMAMQHEELPGTLNVSTPSRLIPWDKLNLCIPTASRPWPVSDKPRIAGVSAFGLSGSNAHVLLEEAPASQQRKRSGPPHLLALSAKTPQALTQRLRDLLDFLSRNPAPPIDSVCYTLAAGRDHYPCRFACTVVSLADAVTSLRETLGSPLVTRAPTATRKPRLEVFFGSRETSIEDLQIIPDLCSDPTLLAWSQRACTAGQSAASTQLRQVVASVAIYSYLRDLGVDPVSVGSIGGGDLPAAWACGLLTIAEACQLAMMDAPSRSAALAGMSGRQAFCSWSGSGENKDWRERISVLSGRPNQSVGQDRKLEGRIGVSVGADQIRDDGLSLGVLAASPQWRREMLSITTRLYLVGVDINWRALYPQGGPDWLDLPTYPYQRERCWLDVGGVARPEPEGASHARRVVATSFRRTKDKDGTSSSQPPRNEVEWELASLWGEILGRKGISVDEDFFDLGGDSNDVLRLMEGLESRLGVVMAPEILLTRTTIDTLSEALWKDDLEHGLLRSMKITDGAPAFFCVHGGAGDALQLRWLARACDRRLSLYAFQLPANWREETWCTSIEAMASRYIEEIRLVQPIGPYLVGGYCFGGAVAFEICRQLIHEGEKINYLVEIDSLAPEQHVLRKRAPLDTIGDQIYYLRNATHGLSALGRAAYLREHLITGFVQSGLLRRLRQSRFGPKLGLRRFWNASNPKKGFIMAHMDSLISAYQLQKIDVDAILFEAEYGIRFGPSLWSKYLRRVEVERIAGDHSTIIGKEESARIVERILATIQPRMTTGAAMTMELDRESA